ncbi:MAG: Bax inhibitor-1 family protein [Planctomycetota bacterium]
MYEATHFDQAVVANAAVDVRVRFLHRTYSHLFGAILLFTAVEVAIFKSGLVNDIMRMFAGAGRLSGLLMFGAFVVGGVLATRTAHTARSLGVQYLSLIGFVLLEALFFVPILYVANSMGGNMIESAAQVTVLAFAGLTALVFVTRKDFSFLRGILGWAGICALIFIVMSFIMGNVPGVGFSVLMVALAGGYVLYDTSNVLHHHPADRHVGAALELFASVAMMFYYILRIFMQRRG